MLKKTETRREKVSRCIQGLFYILAGIPHFVTPGFYLGLIPDYLPDHLVLVNFSGAMEIILGAIILFAPKYYRSIAAIFLIFLLVLFITVHLEFIQRVQCPEQGTCWWLVFGWVRLVVIHPLLIYWAWTIARNIYGKYRESPWQL